MLSLGHWFRVRRSIRREKKKANERPAEVIAAQHVHVKMNPFCAACGCAQHVQAHHIRPFHLAPSLGAAASNLISLCMSSWECHEKLGHGADFRAWNPNIVLDAQASRVALTLGIDRFKAARADIEARAKAARSFT